MSTAKKPSASPVEVRDPQYNLNYFLDLRETHAATEAKIETLKPLIMNLVQKGHTKEAFEGMRKGQSGKFKITIVERYKLDEEKTIELLTDRSLLNKATKVKRVIDEDELAILIRDKHLSDDDVRKIYSKVSTYPKVDFKVGQ